jgi:hypothetical protein
MTGAPAARIAARSMAAGMSSIVPPSAVVSKATHGVAPPHLVDRVVLPLPDEVPRPRPSCRYPSSLGYLVRPNRLDSIAWSSSELTRLTSALVVGQVGLLQRTVMARPTGTMSTVVRLRGHRVMGSHRLDFDHLGSSVDDVMIEWYVRMVPCWRG